MSKEVATSQQVNEGEVQVWDSIPEELLEPVGLDGTFEDVVVPRILLAQALTPAVQKSSEVYIEGLAAGDFFNNVTRKIYGPGVIVIPVLFTKNRILFEGKSINCRSENGVDGGVNSPLCSTCEYARWGTGKDGKGTACTEFRNFVCYVPEDDDFSIISFKKSTAQVGKFFYTTAISQKRIVVVNKGTEDEVKKSIRLPIYGCEYMLTSKEKQNDDGVFYTIGFKRIKDVTDRNLLTHLKAAHDRFKSMAIVVTEDE